MRGRAHEEGRQVNEYVAHYETPRANGTINRELSALKRMFTCTDAGCPERIPHDLRRRQFETWFVLVSLSAWQ